MKKSFTFAVLTLLTGISLHAEETIIIKGSDTLGARLVPQLAEQFRAKNPEVNFQIAAEGSSTGIAALFDNTAKLAMSSRDVTPVEISTGKAKGIDFHPTIVAYDGMAVIVNSANPVNSLTKKQIEQIFAGDITDWSAVGGTPGKISIYTRNTSSGTYKEFQAMAMNKRDYAQSSQKMAGNEQIAAEVGKNPAGIGYVGLAYIKADGIKAEGVDGKKPEAASVQDNSYPYSRPLFYYTNGEPTGLVKKFVDYTLSDDGQKSVVQVGFVSIR